MRRSPLLSLLIALSFPFAAPLLAEESSDHFEKHIRPLLVNKCIECHSGRTPDGNLDLSTAAGFAKGGMNGELLAGSDVDASALYKRLVSKDEDLRMPPEEPLSEQELAVVREWIQAGAVWSRDDAPMTPPAESTPTTSPTKHWAFQSVTRPEPPKVNDFTWCWTDIDRFILSKLEAAGVRPVADADASTWLRRASLDATGLPPTPAELAKFTSTFAPGNQTTEVNRLLSSRAYAERQARHWLDLARYADTSGDGTDTPIPEARYYRDWVIDSFDQDMPYDQFVIDQIAGDILAAQNPDDPDAYKHTIATGYVALSRRFGNSKFAELHQIIDDSIDTIGRSMLGLSLGCARCHHHKFDPVTNEDYYGIYGYFSSTQYPHAGTEHQKERSDLPEIKVPDALCDVMESKVAWAVHDKPEVGDAKVHIAGDPHKKGPVVPRGYLTFLKAEHAQIPAGSSGRMQFAQWVASKENPLTARVMVNRIWQSHFGTGLVPTTSNFGTQAPQPTHHELLDYLAAEFVANGWSVKHIHELIMCSHVYHLASHEEPSQLQVDEANQLLWHFPRQRMDAETFRDSILAVSGKLQPGSNGRHPFKPLEKLQYNQGNPFSEIFEHEHRSVYLMTPRLNRHPMMALFDGADSNVSTPQRGESTVPLQSLFMINGTFVKQQAEALVDRVFAQTENPDERISQAWLLAYSRNSSPEENVAVHDYLTRYSADRQQHGIETVKADREAWVSLARSLMSSNEFMYVD